MTAAALKKFSHVLVALAFALFTSPALATMQEMGPQGFTWPNYPLYMGTLEDSNGAINAFTLSTSTSRSAIMGRVYQNDLTCRNGSNPKNIQSIGYNAGAKSGTWTLQADIEGVATASGPPVQPNGTIAGSGLALATTLSTAVTATSYNTTANLGAVATVHCFDEIALVFSFSAYTSGSLAFAGGLSTDPSPWGPVLSNSTNGGSTWTAAGASAGGTITLLFQLNFDDGTSGTFEGTMPAAYNSANQKSFNTTSTPLEYGLQFSAPFDGQLNGVWVAVSLTNSSSNATLKLTDTASTPNVLWSANLLGSQANAAGARQGMAWFPITGARITVTRNMNYVLAITGTSASPNNASISVSSFPGSTSLQAFFGCGAACGVVSRNSSSAAWSGFSNATMPYMSVSYAAIDDNTGP